MRICFIRISVLTGLLFTTFSLFSIETSAQNSDNYLALNMYIYTNANLNTSALLENRQRANNAFRLTVETKDRHAFIYAAVPDGIRTSTNQVIPASKLLLQLNNTDCNPGQQRYVVTNEIPLSISPQLLFEQGKKNNQIANWYYDVILDPLGYEYAPGTYNFTLEFTMTQP